MRTISKDASIVQRRLSQTCRRQYLEKNTGKRGRKYGGNTEVRHVVARATRHEHTRETRAILEATVPAVTQ
mgnify:CR=1 FL=1